MTTLSGTAPASQGHEQQDPSDVFLTREALFTRHGYRRTRGYQYVNSLLEDPTFPRPLGEVWRLDHIRAWEDRAAGMAAAASPAAATLQLAQDATAEPAKRRPGRPRRQAA